MLALEGSFGVPSGVARISVMVGHVTKISGEGCRGESGGSQESFPTVKLHYTITKYDTRAYCAYNRSGLNCERAAHY